MSAPAPGLPGPPWSLVQYRTADGQLGRGAYVPATGTVVQLPEDLPGSSVLDLLVLQCQPRRVALRV